LALGGIAAKKIFGSGGAIGSRTVESIAKIAIAAGATIELYSPASPKFILKITPAEGRRVRKFATRNKKLKKPLSKEKEAEFRLHMRGAIADAVQRRDETSKRLVAAFAEILTKHSLGHLLLEMADEFEREGDIDAAALLRAAHGAPRQGRPSFAH
jgi:hypothetical protein